MAEHDIQFQGTAMAAPTVPIGLCHAKDYCGVPIGWLMNIQTHMKRTFIGEDQAESEFNAVNEESQGLRMLFSVEEEPPDSFAEEMVSGGVVVETGKDFAKYIKAKIKQLKNPPGSTVRGTNQWNR